MQNSEKLKEAGRFNDSAKTGYPATPANKITICGVQKFCKLQRLSRMPDKEFSWRLNVVKTLTMLSNPPGYKSCICLQINNTQLNILSSSFSLTSFFFPCDKNWTQTNVQAKQTFY